ncbi:MAG: hypothetical protein ACTSP4_01700, partial [Candidatus Hodarchaeales archaeon]
MKLIGLPKNLMVQRIVVFLLCVLVTNVTVSLVTARSSIVSGVLYPGDWTYVEPSKKLLHVEAINKMFFYGYDYRSGQDGFFMMNYQGIATHQESNYDISGDIMDYCYDGKDSIYIVTKHQLLVYNIWSLDYERIYTSLDTSFLGSYSITRCYADQNRVYMGTQ